MIFKIIEKFLIIVCTIVLYFLKFLYKLEVVIRVICEFVAVILIFNFAVFLIKSLNPFWESVVLQVIIISSAFSFLCMIVLAIWKNKEFNQLFDKFF